MKKSLALWIATLLLSLQTSLVQAQGEALYDEGAEKVHVIGTEDHDMIYVTDEGVAILSFDSQIFDEVPNFITTPGILKGPGVVQKSFEMPHFDTADVTCDDGHDIVIMIGAFQGRVYGGIGDDQVRTDNKGTTFYGHEGNDEFTGSDYNDIVLGGPGMDRIDLGGGNDIAYGGPEDDRIKGGSGDDVIYGDGDNDTIHGGPGMDKLMGNDGDDKIYGGEDEDTLVDGSGSDTLDGGFDGAVDTLILRDDDFPDRAIRRYVGERRFVPLAEGTSNLGIAQIGGAFTGNLRFRFEREIFEEDRVFGGDDLDEVADEIVDN